MKFFTPDLIERFGSDDHEIALTAETELEQRSEEYSRILGEIELELPQRFREMLDRHYLHDARVIDHSCLGNGDSGSLGGLEPGVRGTGWRPIEGAEGRLLSFWMVLELDTPPREVLALQYRSVLIEGPTFINRFEKTNVPIRSGNTMKSNLPTRVAAKSFATRFSLRMVWSFV